MCQHVKPLKAFHFRENSAPLNLLLEHLEPAQQIELDHYPRFRCLGADCPDSCCEGWEINVDQKTFGKYQTCADSPLHDKFQRLIKINDKPTERNYASIQLTSPVCPFLDERLCSIQKRLGEEYLSHTCATFPRNIHQSFGLEERSLDLSCPEAARLALTGSQPIRFSFPEEDPQWQLRGSVLKILQNRSLRIPQRLASVAQLCDSLTAPAKLGDAKERSQWDRPRIDSGLQLRVVLELINARIRLAFVSQRFLDLYREFAAGIQMEASSDWEGVVRRYAEAGRHHFAPFFDSHQHMFENYLVSYAFKSALPVACSSRHTGVERKLNSSEQYLLMAAYYSITRAVMIGVAGKRKDAFGTLQALDCIQITAKALDHCLSYPEEVLKILASHGIKDAAQTDVLTGK